MGSKAPAPDLSWNITQSPFASVMQTNYVPSAEDLIRLNDLLAEPRLQLTQLESEVARVQNLLDNLSGEKETVQKYIDAHHALISPMRRLRAALQRNDMMRPGT